MYSCFSPVLSIVSFLCVLSVLISVSCSYFLLSFLCFLSTWSCFSVVLFILCFLLLSLYINLLPQLIFSSLFSSNIFLLLVCLSYRLCSLLSFHIYLFLFLSFFCLNFLSLLSRSFSVFFSLHTSLFFLPLFFASPFHPLFFTVFSLYVPGSCFFLFYQYFIFFSSVSLCLFFHHQP